MRYLTIFLALLFVSCSDSLEESDTSSPDVGIAVDVGVADDVGVDVGVDVDVGVADASLDEDTQGGVIDDAGILDSGEVDAADAGSCQSSVCDGGQCVRCSDNRALEFDRTENTRPDGLAPNTTTQQVHFRFDTTERDYIVPVDGDSDRRIVQRVEAGQVSLLVADTSTTTVVGPGWRMLPMASFSPSQGLVFCWVNLSGSETDATEGGMPDPRNGADPVCIISTDNGATWSAEILIPHATAAAWMVDLKYDSVSDSFIVTVYEDEHGTLVNQWDLTRVMSYPLRDGILGDGYVDSAAVTN